MFRRKFGLIALLAGLLLLFGAGHSQAQQSTLKLGVAPHSSARFILKLYQPLRAHLSQTLGMPVEVVTAPNFTEFLRRAANQEYDVVITTGNQARLLQVDYGYKLLVTYQAEFRAVTVVASDSNIRGPKDLQGKRLLGLNPASLVTQWGMHWVKEHGLQNNEIRYVSAADSVAQLLIAGDAAAGFVSQTNYLQLPLDVQQQLRIIAQSATMAGRIYMLNMRHAASQKKIESALWSFAKSQEGKYYFSSYKLGGYRKLRQRELESMERYADDLRKTIRPSQ